MPVTVARRVGPQSAPQRTPIDWSQLAAKEMRYEDPREQLPICNASLNLPSKWLLRYAGAQIHSYFTANGLTCKLLQCFSSHHQFEGLTCHRWEWILIVLTTYNHDKNPSLILETPTAHVSIQLIGHVNGCLARSQRVVYPALGP